MITPTDSHGLARLQPVDARAAVGGDEPTNFTPWFETRTQFLVRGDDGTRLLHVVPREKRIAQRWVHDQTDAGEES